MVEQAPNWSGRTAAAQVLLSSAIGRVPGTACTHHSTGPRGENFSFGVSKIFLEAKGAAAAGESFYIVPTDARLQGQWVERTLPVLLRWRSHLHETCVAAASRTAPGSWVRGGHRTRRVGRADSTEATPKVSLGEGVTFTKSHSGSRCDMSPASALRAVPPPPHATPTCPARRARRSGWICEVAPPLTHVGQRVERSSK